MKVIFGLIMLFVLSGCVSSKLTFYDENTVLIFINTQNTLEELHFYKKRFSFLNLLKHNEEAQTYDTITYGKWENSNKNFITLTSPERWEELYFLKMNVVEEKTAPSDTLYFILDNPLEKDYVQNKYNTRPLRYAIQFWSGQGLNYNHLEKQDKNVIKVPITKNFDNRLFSIYAYVAPDLPLKVNIDVIETLPYEVQNLASNTFLIDIPELDYKYIQFKSLNKDYVRIKNKDTLVWNGKVYVIK